MTTPQRFNSECPKCGEGIYSLAKSNYCWRHLQKKCPVWKSYGGEHLHRTCTCGYIYAILPKDQSDILREEDGLEWLNEKLDEACGAEDSILIRPEDIDWEPSSDCDPHKRSDIG